MQKNILFNLIVGISVATTGLISIPAHAQDNQSDITGNNVFNSTVPANNQSDITGNTINPETAAQAEELSQELRDAYRSCRAGEGCVEFNNFMQESNTFLSNINQESEVYENSQTNRAW